MGTAAEVQPIETKKKRGPFAQDVGAERRDAWTVRLEDIVIDESFNSRAFPHTNEEIELLALDIFENGQDQEAIVQVRLHDKRPYLVAGFGRAKAIGLINTKYITDPEKHMPLRVKLERGNEEEMFLRNLAENHLHKKPTIVDDSYAIQQLRKRYGYNDDKIRSVFSNEMIEEKDGNGNPTGRMVKKPKSPGWLQDRDAIASLEQEYRKMIHDGTIPAATGKVLAKMAPDKRAQFLEDQINGSKSGKVKATAVKAAAEDAGLVKATGPRKIQEVKSSFSYLVENATNQKVKRLASAFLQFQERVIEEPDLFRIINELLAK